MEGTLITPDELNTLLAELDIEPSVVACNARIARSRVREFCDGNANALTDEERSTLRERLLVPEDKSVAHREEQKAIIDGAGEFLRKHSVFYMYEKDGIRQTASGTLVTIGDKLFVATARHTIPNGTQMLEFIGANSIYVEASEEKAPNRRDWKGQGKVKILNGGRHKEFDVGFLELELSALDILKHEAIPLSSVSVRPMQYGRTAFLFGFPFELEREGRLTNSKRLLLVTSMTYPNPVLAPEEWPPVPENDRQPQQSIDCFLRYSRTDPNKQIVPIGRDANRTLGEIGDQLPEVFGMSGGGFWQRWKPVLESELWFACDYELFAIQSSWWDKERYVRGIQVKHWLDLVGESYPDLKVQIEEHFASQQQSSM